MNSTSVRDTRQVGDLLLELLPLAIVCALSPWAIVAVILMLASDRPSNSVVWLVGWTLSTLAIGILVVVFFGGYDFSPKSTPTTVACVVQGVLGGLLLFACGRVLARGAPPPWEPSQEACWVAPICQKMPALGVLIVG